MYSIIESKKSFEVASNDLEAAVKNNGFGVLHIHDLGETLRSKGIDYGEECRVFEVCNPQQAAKVLAIDVRLNMALPCRISVYTEQGAVKIGYIKPAEMLSALSSDPALAAIASEVESSMIDIMNGAK
ncbi:DUF302 domain-containing protein [Microbulbifer hainanensis]|uniref:DUF302 domain-containing protein n=1 Tax=Microbulbifer hainanensis TaxID=2735675 RepID=UPI00186668D4|nr:DUF302 domain-containing protein [Microbulbifer hainanensis]